MGEKVRYSSEELKEFEVILTEKLEDAKKEFKYIKDRLSHRSENDANIDGTLGGNSKPLEDGASTAEKESLNQLAARQKKFMNQLEMALIRIKKGTYGICVDTGRLIPKERLRIVPHTRHSIEAKNARL